MRFSFSDRLEFSYGCSTCWAIQYQGFGSNFWYMRWISEIQGRKRIKKEDAGILEFSSFSLMNFAFLFIYERLHKSTKHRRCGCNKVNIRGYICTWPEPQEYKWCLPFFIYTNRILFTWGVHISNYYGFSERHSL